MRWCAWNPVTEEWWFDLNFWESFNNTGDGGSYNANPYEQGYVAKHSNPSPVGAAPVIQDLLYLASRGFQAGTIGDTESFENMSLLNRPITV